MFSQTVDYALRAMVWLASEPETAMTTQQIALATRVPSGYLSKVLQSLGRAELVNSQRGLRGGFTLARPPEEISLLDVVNAVDPIRRIRECPLGIKSHGRTLCPLHSRLDAAIAGIEKAFSDSNLADLLKQPSRSKPLCEVTVSAKKS